MEILYRRLPASGAALALAFVLGGCWRAPTLDQPARLVDATTERQQIAEIDRTQETNYRESSGRQRKRIRNDIITDRMLAIDIEYTNYEARLTHEAQETSFAMNAASLGLTTTAALIPVAQTSRMLSGIATGVNGLDNAYDQKIMFTRAIQNIQTQMRASRNEIAARIYSRLSCSTTIYPLGMAKSDLEAYYRAGTFTSGLVNLSNTVNQAETQSMVQKDAASPAAPAGTKTVATATDALQKKVEDSLAVKRATNCPITASDKSES